MNGGEGAKRERNIHKILGRKEEKWKRETDMQIKLKRFIWTEEKIEEKRESGKGSYWKK